MIQIARLFFWIVITTALIIFVKIGVLLTSESASRIAPVDKIAQMVVKAAKILCAIFVKTWRQTMTFRFIEKHFEATLLDFIGMQKRCVAGIRSVCNGLFE